MVGPADETTRERWQRRVVSVPAYLVLCLAALTIFPVVLPIAAAVDLVRRRRWVLSRCLSFFVFYLCCEVAGVAISLMVWLTTGPWLGGQEREYVERNFRLQCWWARTLLRGATEIFGLKFAVEMGPEIGHGPMLLFLRHTGVGDTLLPSVFLAERFHIIFRYVLKRELLWDPCLDIVGQRLPNYFARRGSGASQREIGAVQSLLLNLGRDDGVLIYPEGTRFTPQKRQRALEKMRHGGETGLLSLAQTLRHTLPPRLGGPLGLLEKNPGADVVFCAHTGFDGAGTFHDLLKGTLIDATIRVTFWRVPYAEIPVERGAQAEWLYRQWQRVDDWVARNAAA